MTVGLGIFLAVFFALVVWQVDKHNKWRSLRRVLLWFGAALVLAGAAFGGYLWWESSGVERDRRAQAVLVRSEGPREYWGLRPGMTEAEVSYAKGKPTSLQDEGDWIYHQEFDSHSYSIDWTDAKVRSIQCWGSNYGCEEVLGIGLGDTERAITETLGLPPKPSELTGDGSKVVAYGSKQFGFLVFILQQDKVSQIAVFGPTEDAGGSASAPP